MITSFQDKLTKTGPRKLFVQQMDSVDYFSAMQKVGRMAAKQANIGNCECFPA